MAFIKKLLSLQFVTLALSILLSRLPLSECTSAQGFIRAYYSDWVVDSNGSNVVNTSMTVEVFVTSNTLRTFTQDVLTDSGKGFISDMQVFDDTGAQLTGAFSTDSNSDTISFTVTLREGVNRQNSPLILTYKYLINNHICQEGDKQVFRTRYLNGIDVRIEDIQQSLQIPGPNVMSFSPDARTSNTISSNESTTLFLTYFDDQLEIGDRISAGAFSEIAWEGVVVTPTQECPEIVEPINFFLVVLITIPSMVLTCVLLSMMYRRFYMMRYPDAPSPFSRFNMFPGNNVIVLSPTDHVETVEAVIHEDDDALDAIAPVTSIRVSIDEYYPPGETVPQRVPRPGSVAFNDVELEDGPQFTPTPPQEPHPDDANEEATPTRRNNGNDSSL
mmetsp:Transcript_784/g.968  ORF Transcript_784/g.968 Transcript_784/m.968 type:complete len:388 (-) Transcript_784:301-1464(-)